MDPDITKTQEERKEMERQLASMTSTVVIYDTDLYGGSDRDGYLNEIPVNDEGGGENLDPVESEVVRKMASYTAPKSLLEEMSRGGGDDEDGVGGGSGFKKPQRIIDREDDYRRRKLNRELSLEGYKILEPPASYVPIRTPARKVLATPTPFGTPLYSIPEENRNQMFDIHKESPAGLPCIKQEDLKYFRVLLNDEDEENLSPAEQKERKITKLLLKIKNGTPPQRKTALRQLTDKAPEFGAGPRCMCRRRWVEVEGEILYWCVFTFKKKWFKNNNEKKNRFKNGKNKFICFNPQNR